MATGDYIPRKDTELQAWLGPFTSVMGLNLTTLGLSAGDLTSISVAKTTFDLKMTDYALKHDAAEAATQAKEAARDAVVAKARELAQRIQAKADVSDELKASLGLTVPGSHPPPPEVPYPPSDLVLEILQPGYYKLKWKANGNTAGTLYLVELKIMNTTAFVPVVTISKTSYTHQNPQPHDKMTYRVRAQRGTNFSMPSNLVVVNDDAV